MKESAIIQLVLTLATVLGGGAAMVGWAYETFEPKDLSRERLAQTEKRLERIESKIDLLADRLSEPQGKGH
jgi:hypothetical protein